MLDKRPLIVDEQEYNNIFADAQKFNEFLWRYHDQIVESTLRSIPAMVTSLIKHSAVMSETVQEFYKNHPEFKDAKHLVAGVIETLQGEHPGMGTAELLELAIPIIERRIKEAIDLDQTIKRPDLSKANETLNSGSINGVV